MIGKKGQIGETMIWIVATLIIVVILGISIFLVSFLFKGSDKEFDYGVDGNFFVSKSITGYLLDDGVYEKLFSVEDEGFPIGSRIFGLFADRFSEFAGVEIIFNKRNSFYPDASDYEVVFLDESKLVAADLGGENE